MPLLLLLVIFPGLVDGKVRKAEVDQVKCEVCKLAMAEARDLQLEKGPEGKLEETLMDLAENLCTLSRREGRWLRRLDVFDDLQGHVKVKNMTQYGECRNECLLVRKACSIALSGQQEDIVNYLRKGLDTEALRTNICKKVCAKTHAPLRKGQRTNEEYVPGLDKGMLEIAENRDKLRAETGQVFDIMRREDMDTISDGDMEAQAAQDAFAEEMREARSRSGLDWRGKEVDDL